MGGSQKKKDEEGKKKRKKKTKTTFRARNTESFTERQKSRLKIVNGRQAAQNLFVLFCFVFLLNPESSSESL
jgi:hypothetical protein